MDAQLLQLLRLLLDVTHGNDADQRKSENGKVTEHLDHPHQVFLTSIVDTENYKSNEQ